MPNETEIKDILVTFFRDATKGDYLQALNKAVSEISGLSPIAASADYVGRDEADAIAISEAKELWQSKNKLDACKRLRSEGWGIKAAHDYCSKYFG